MSVIHSNDDKVLYNIVNDIVPDDAQLQAYCSWCELDLREYKNHVVMNMTNKSYMVTEVLYYCSDECVRLWNDLYCTSCTYYTMYGYRYRSQATEGYLSTDPIRLCQFPYTLKLILSSCMH